MDMPSLSAVLFLWIMASSSFGIGFGQNGIINVLDFGAFGDSESDDSQAFLKGWQEVCDTPGKTLSIPAGKTFILKPLQFIGPCKSNNVQIQIDGNINGPSSLDDWADSCKRGCWLCFENVNGLVIKGKGLINGQGSIWWNKKSNLKCGAPTALFFHKCNQLQLNGITSRDSPKRHIFIHNSNDVRISNIHVNAPESSPNTDGIGISLSSKVNIHDSFIATGDDCVGIVGGSSFINITHVTCGPGHGFSVGSLGKDGAKDEVEEIHVQNCMCIKTQNCARIKTWMGGSGYAKGINFKQMTLKESKYPIIINQHYCNGEAHCPVQSGAVEVSDVTFSDFEGTSASKQAITLDCSDLGCDDILIDNVQLTSAVPGNPELQSLCNNASGKISSTTPDVPCLSNTSPSPIPAPMPTIEVNSNPFTLNI